MLAIRMFSFLMLLSAATCLAKEPEPTITKRVLRLEQTGENLLNANAWQPYEQGFQREGELIVCDNGSDMGGRRGITQTVVLNQTRPEPILAIAQSKAQDVTGGLTADYSLYLDLLHTDGTPLWGQIAGFGKGSHDWQEARVSVMPSKPVKSLTFNLLLRHHSGKASFRKPQLFVVNTPPGAYRFDGQPVAKTRKSADGFQIRDVAADSDFVRIDRQALDLTLDCQQTKQADATFFDVTLSDTSGKDRAVTLVYSVPFKGRTLQWFEDPRRSVPVEPGREYIKATSVNVGSHGYLSQYPLGAVADTRRGMALGIDMTRPAFYRIGYNAAAGELFLAYDLGLSPEKPTAKVRFCRFTFKPKWGFRAALAHYYELFPEQFRCRTPQQGVWMPFAKISEVEGWQDFGFKFKEGNNETAWDDQHGIVTFRYTEPLTWWMPMPADMPRTDEAALAEAKRLAAEGHARAKGLLTSGYHNAAGKLSAWMLDTPWCNGAVWSINSMPGIQGEVTDFKNKWNPTIRENLYGPNRTADLDGEYIDSSEGYRFDELDFRRDHFASADTPLTFSPHDHRPAIFRGLVAFEYARGLARDVHKMDKLMMANSTPAGLCWLAPWLDVMGIETNWNPNNQWAPMSDADLLYRRVLCKGKPYCFLMNTPFKDFSHAKVEKYMKRCLAYGMFPGFFSHNAAEGQYFTQPALYNRDRPLFKKYVPLCKRVAEAGWEPITGASSDDEHVYIERFGHEYLTVFNDSPQQRTVTIRLEGKVPESSRELLTDQPVKWRMRQTKLTLKPEDVAVIQLARP